MQLSRKDIQQVFNFFLFPHVGGYTSPAYPVRHAGPLGFTMASLVQIFLARRVKNEHRRRNRLYCEFLVLFLSSHHISGNPFLYFKKKATATRSNRNKTTGIKSHCPLPVSKCRLKIKHIKTVNIHKRHKNMQADRAFKENVALERSSRMNLSARFLLPFFQAPFCILAFPNHSKASVEDGSNKGCRRGHAEMHKAWPKKSETG